MNKNFTTTILFFAITLSLMVSGCGTSDSPKASSAANASKSTVFGIATLDSTTVGTVSIKDSSVPTQEKTATVSSNGEYTADVSGLTAPFMIKASGTDQTGENQVLYSVSTSGGCANINELSDTAVAAAAEDQEADQDMLYVRSNSVGNLRTADKFVEVVNSLRTVLAPLFALYQISGDPITDEANEETSGLRSLLRDVKFKVTNGNVVVTNRETGGIIYSGQLKDLASGTFYPENMPAGLVGATTCTYTYSDWGACQSNSTQTRTMLTSSPADCTGTPVLSQTCTYVPPTPSTCTYNYSSWGVCQSDSTQTRTVLQSTPVGCTGTPVLLQRCTYVPPVTTCTSFTYSAWGTCQSNSTQTRTLLTSSPAGCTGGSPVLSQSCTYVPPIDGAALYTQYCSGCHGNSKKGSSVSAIQNAIATNRGGMGSLSNLTLEQITAISTAP